MFVLFFGCSQGLRIRVVCTCSSGFISCCVLKFIETSSNSRASFPSPAMSTVTASLPFGAICGTSTSSKRDLAHRLLAFIFPLPRYPDSARLVGIRLNVVMVKCSAIYSIFGDPMLVSVYRLTFCQSDGRRASRGRRARSHFGQVDLQALQRLPQLRRSHPEEFRVHAHDLRCVQARLLV